MTASATFFELAHDPEKLALWQRLDEGAALFQSDRARSKPGMRGLLNLTPAR
jgi:hypothetical protein